MGKLLKYLMCAVAPPGEMYPTQHLHRYKKPTTVRYTASPWPRSTRRWATRW
jgi:hypothetical protein